MSQPPSTAEFDSYSRNGYFAGMEDSIKSSFGKSATVFHEHKAAWLLSFLKQQGHTDNSKLRLLDFGCGTGTFLHVLQKKGLQASLDGCDVSQGMIQQSATLEFPGERPNFQHFAPGVTHYKDNTFDVITVSSVYHHIEPKHRAEVTREIHRILKPGGSIVVFEHNPWNPLTRLIVARCAIDANAVLLSKFEMAGLLKKASFKDVKVKFILFVPNFEWLWPWEKLLSWLPLGGQYAATASKS